MVMIVTGVVINTFRGQFSASASTGSKVYINIEDSRVLELSHRHTDSETELQVIATPVYFSPSQTNLMKSEIATLMELIYFEDPKTAEVYHFLCQVKIIGILEQKWRYHGCPYCNKKTMESGNTYWCRQCNREVLAENKYRITLDVEDRTTVSTFVVFGKEAENLIKVSAQEVSRTIEYNNEREIFPEIIKSIIGKTIKVQVKLTKYNFEEGNESFTVTKLIEAIEGDSQESQEVEVVDLHEDALLQTPKHISKDKTVFTPLTNTPLKPKIEKIFKSSPLRIKDLGEDENIQRNSTIKETEDLKRKRTSNECGKEKWI
ncbi:uncharacterized protein A4U43_C04F10330 [Asparagus officinalis]|nr:uncharacterized protein A4U43_C04F10330 [Asparagus officinalis]